MEQWTFVLYCPVFNRRGFSFWHQFWRRILIMNLNVFPEMLPFGIIIGMSWLLRPFFNALFSLIGMKMIPISDTEVKLTQYERATCRKKDFEREKEREVPWFCTTFIRRHIWQNYFLILSNLYVDSYARSRVISWPVSEWTDGRTPFLLKPPSTISI